MPERRQLRSIAMPSDMALSALCVTNNGSTATVGSWDNSVYDFSLSPLLLFNFSSPSYVYSLEYGRVLDTLVAHDDAVSAVCVRGDNMLTASWDSSVKLWRAPQGGKYKQPPVAEFLEHDSEVCSYSASVEYVVVVVCVG